MKNNPSFINSCQSQGILNTCAIAQKEEHKRSFCFSHFRPLLIIIRVPDDQKQKTPLKYTNFPSNKRVFQIPSTNRM